MAASLWQVLWLAAPAPSHRHRTYTGVYGGENEGATCSDLERKGAGGFTGGGAVLPLTRTPGRAQEEVSGT